MFGRVSTELHSVYWVLPSLTESDHGFVDIYLVLPSFLGINFYNRQLRRAQRMFSQFKVKLRPLYWVLPSLNKSGHSLVDFYLVLPSFT